MLMKGRRRRKKQTKKVKRTSGTLDDCAEKDATFYTV
jgi:hypothetical protein